MSRRSEARAWQIKTVLHVPMIHYNPFCKVLKNRTHKAAYSDLIKRGLYAPVPNRNYVYAITPAGLEIQKMMTDNNIYREPLITIEQTENRR